MLQPRRNLITIVPSPSTALIQPAVQAAAATIVAAEEVLRPQPEEEGIENVSRLVGSADTAMRSWLSDPRRYAAGRPPRPILRGLAMAVVAVLAAMGSILALIAVGAN